MWAIPVELCVFDCAAAAFLLWFPFVSFFFGTEVVLLLAVALLCVLRRWRAGGVLHRERHAESLPVCKLGMDDSLCRVAIVNLVVWARGNTHSLVCGRVCVEVCILAVGCIW